jgi:DsbC/DsbD-like thiol-disulfide interchange protein
MERKIGATVGVWLLLGASLAAAPRARHVEASLVAETAAVQPGRPLTVGLHLRMEPTWHTYWRNPGDSGLPTRVEWELPEGFSAGELQWPQPVRFHTGPLVSYGYEHEVLLPVQVQVPTALASREVHLTARVRWLECREICLPGKAELSLSLPVRPSAAPGPAAALFEQARRRLPRRDEAWGFSASAAAGSIGLVVSPPPGTTLEEAYFYPVTRRVLDYSKPQTLSRVAGGYRLELPRDPNGAAVDRMEGVLVGRTPAGSLALEVAVRLENRTAALARDRRGPIGQTFKGGQTP